MNCRKSSLKHAIVMTMIMATGVLLGLSNSGCSADSAATTQPSFTEKQQRALKDPFGYTPANHDPRKAEDAAAKKEERSNTLKGDWDRLWNP